MSNKKLLYGIMSSSSIIGFYRGARNYEFNYNEKMNKYEKMCQTTSYSYDIIEKPKFFYYEYFSFGMCGMIMYVNPFCLLKIIPREIYRLEVNLRNLEDEKKTRYYNEIM